MLNLKILRIECFEKPNALRILVNKHEIFSFMKNWANESLVICGPNILYEFPNTKCLVIELTVNAPHPTVDSLSNGSHLHQKKPMRSTPSAPYRTKTFHFNKDQRFYMLRVGVFAL